MKKILIRIVLGVAVLGIIAVICMALFINSIVKKGIETAGPKATQAPVTVESVSLSILSGSGKVTGLNVGNPEGFKTPMAIKAGSASVQVQPSSLLSGKLIVKSVRVEAPEITLEAGLKGSNLGALLANVEAYTGGGGQAKPAEKSGERKLQVDDFVITGAKVNLSMTLMGGKAATVPLPDIHLTNLGTGPEGISAGELTQKVLKEIVESVTKAAGSALGKTGEVVGDAAKGVGKTAGEAVDKATKGLGNLFKK
jgi:uncharacterized protein involved in outer membrane biogenesis